MITSEKVAQILLSIKAISINPTKPYRYDSGILSPVYIDCRLLMGYPKERGIIRDLYIEAMKSTKENFDAVAGTATAGIPHTAFIAEKLLIPMLYVRGKAKDHGKGNRVEGVLRKGQNVAAIEDLISTGDSSMETVMAVRNSENKCSYVFAIITYGIERASRNFQKHKVKLVTLTDFVTAVAVARKLHYIRANQERIILEWTSDPSSWGKRMGFE